MICDNCSGRKICKFKEDCMIFERNMNSNIREDSIFNANIVCKEKRIETLFRDRDVAP